MQESSKNNAYNLTQVIFAVFRVNGKLIDAGDRLVSKLGLTSSRWRILGAIAGQASTVPQVARIMGLTRQGVQRTANALAFERFISFQENPAHATASLLLLTPKGKAVLAKATEIQTNWSRDLARNYTSRELKVTMDFLQKLNESLHIDRVSS